MAEFRAFQIELSKAYGLTEWREDIKGLMLDAGLYNSESVFLFSDSQVYHINNKQPSYLIQCAL